MSALLSISLLKYVTVLVQWKKLEWKKFDNIMFLTEHIPLLSNIYFYPIVTQQQKSCIC